MVDFDYRQSILTIDSRFWAVSAEGGRKKKREKKIWSPMLLFAPAIHRMRAISSPRAGRRNVSPRGEKEQGYVVPFFIF
ncbi:hypothetical protein BHM03_00045644 [Ensete ventricosum]|nr:hypothetical protein BHM03_00045644 [Ensete ventricosum]